MGLLLIAILACSIIHMEQACLDLNSKMKFEPGKRYNGYVYITDVVGDVYWCANLCYSETLCESFNYNSETRICERSYTSTSQTTSLVNEVGSVYMKSTDIPKEVAGVCSQHTCARDQQCRPFNNVATCVMANRCYNMINGRGIYDGTRKHTKQGHTCQRWDSQAVHTHPGYLDSLSDFPTDRSWDEVSNNCRTPEIDSGISPWCYTMDPNTRFESCDIPQC